MFVAKFLFGPRTVKGRGVVGKHSGHGRDHSRGWPTEICTFLFPFFHETPSTKSYLAGGTGGFEVGPLAPTPSPAAEPAAIPPRRNFLSSAAPYIMTA